MSNIKSKDRKSLFEESMLVFVNILKLSSLSLARRRNLITTSDHDHDEHNYDENHDHQHEVSLRATYNKNQNKVDHNDAPPLVHEAASQRSKRLQKAEPAPECKMSYVMLPENYETGTINNVDGQFSDYIKRFHEKTVNDLENAKATNYIKRFHEKNMKDLNNESMRRSHYVLPPPPHHHHHLFK